MADRPGQMERIAAKLAAVPNTPGRGHSFGAERHGYRLNPPATEEEVSAFEERYSVRLPADFRAFVTTLGDGGAGPCHGVLPLRRCELAEPHELDIYPGSMTVVEQGDSAYVVLVLEGPHAGRLISLSADRHGDHTWLEDAGFCDLYERWLDAVLAGHRISGGFARSLPGDEATLVEILTADPSPERRQRAAISLCQLPELTPESELSVLESGRREPAPALWIARRFRWRSAAPLARGVLTALASPPDAPPVDRATAVAAYYTLAESGALTVDDVAALVGTVLESTARHHAATDPRAADGPTARAIRDLLGVERTTP